MIDELARRRRAEARRRNPIAYVFGRYVLGPLVLLLVVALLLWGIVSAVRGMIGA